MNVLNEPVYHHKFGTGIVTDQTETNISVKFSELDDIKKFVYPTVFEFYLRLCNSEIQVKMNDEIQQIQMQMEAERKQKEENGKHRQEELCQKQAALRKVSKTKKSTAKKIQKVSDPAKEDSQI